MQHLLVKALFFFSLFFLISSSLGSDENDTYPTGKISTPILQVESQWVDSVLNALSIEEKVAQLFMVAVYSNKSDKYNQQIIKEIKKYQIGGVIFMQGGPVRQASLCNKLQEVVKIPLMVGIDGEHGLAMRLDSTIAYPKAMAIGAIKKDQLAFDMGAEIARQCNRLNIHINFAPVVDVNSNPKNPIINVRSFGEDKLNVARKGLAYSMGLQSNHVMAVCKHFPGHGDTDKDSHKTLPSVNHSIERINDIELYPFKNLIDNGVGGVMVAHLSVPNINQGQASPVSLSPLVVDTLLRKEMGFDGLVFTDALNMKGVTRDYSPGEIEVKALLAGNDVLLFPNNVEIAISAIIESVRSGEISEAMIDDRCKRILKAKKWFGLNQYSPIDEAFLVSDINNSEARALRSNLIQHSITQIASGESLMPIEELDKKRILAVSIGARNSVFQQMLCNYTQVDTLSISKNTSEQELQLILERAQKYNVVIVSKHNTNNSPWKNYGTTHKDIDFLNSLSDIAPVIVAYFGSPYGLKEIASNNKVNNILIAYNDFAETNSLMAQAIFGGIPITGKLPVSINEQFPVGFGIDQPLAIRLKYTNAAEFELPDTAFNKVDSIINAAIDMKAMPGCQVLYAKDGKVVYSKNIGYKTYEKDESIEASNIYDIASVTKVTATTISMMQLYEQNKINITEKLSAYLPEFKVKGKRKIKIHDVMAHQAKFHSWIPFYKNTLNKEGEVRSDIYANERQDGFEIPICDGLFMRNDYVDSVYQSILDTPIYKSKKYRYSDLGFYWLAKLVKNESGVAINDFVDENYYSKLGMNRTSYLPLEKFAKTEIVPSENDRYYRKKVVQGYVHDPGAAMLGGVSGHAGVFSNANDLAKLGQMLLNQGSYGGEQFFKPKTLDVFNESRFKRKDNRRGLGFDKPALQIGDPGPTCESASHSSFGHSGFTGAYFWVDPEDQSVFIFLSNRTFPDQNNTKLVDQNIRTEIHQAFYDVFEHQK